MMKKEKASILSYLGTDSIVNSNTVLSMGRVVATDLPSREAILSDFMNSEEDTIEEESSLTASVVLAS